MNDHLTELLFNRPEVNLSWYDAFNRQVDSPNESLPDIERLIELHYQTHPDAMDGFSRLACVLMHHNECNRALALFERDAAIHRQTWWQQLRHAECVATMGKLKTAFALVEHVYAEYPNAVNGYASIAWRLRNLPGLLQSPWACAQKDIARHRLSAGFKLNVAELAFRHDAQTQAINLVETAYKQAPHLKDGYSRCAWSTLWPKGQYKQLIALMEKDRALDRLSPAWILKLGRVYAAIGKTDTALLLVDEAYRADTNLMDGHVQLARVCRRTPHHVQQSLQLCLKDVALNRLASNGAVFTAHTQMMLGLFEDALALLKDICDPPSRFWAKAIRLWAHSYRWPLSPHLTDDDILSQLLHRHKHAPEHADPEACRIVHHSLALMATMRNRLLVMSQRSGVDLHNQMREISDHRHDDDPANTPLPFLNAKLYCASASDLLHLFNEIILSESDHFEAGTDEPYILDCGTNIGTSLAYFKWLYPNARIVAFEPNPAVRAICERNIELNNWKGITLLPYALAGKQGDITFHCDKDMPMASTLLNRPAEEGRRFTPVTVQARNLNDFVDGPVDFLKLDIEGAECEVLLALDNLLDRVHRGIIEYHHGNPQNSLSRILGILEHAGRPYTIKEPFYTNHLTGIRQITPRWSRSIFFDKPMTNAAHKPEET